MNPQEANLRTNWRLKKLIDVCEINPAKREIEHLNDDTEVSFLPMSGISEDGVLVNMQTKKLKDVKKGFTYFRNGDVLFAKITPCMENGKRWLASSLTNSVGFGSTEFHVLRPKTEITSEWLYYFISRQTLREEAEKKMTGTAGQKRVPKQFLKSLRMPVPPIKAQQDLTEGLIKADKLIQKRKQANHVTNNLLQTVFVQMFGDSIGNTKKWSKARIGDIAEIVRGSSPRPKSDPRYYGGSVPRLMIADITRDGCPVTPKIDSLTEEGAKRSRPIKKGTIVMAVSGNVGLTSIVNVDCCIHDGFVALLNLSDKFDAVFLREYLESIRTVNLAKSSGAIWKNLTTDEIRAIEVPTPPTELQRKFAQFKMSLDNLRAKQLESLIEIGTLFSSLLTKAFKGELDLSVD